MDCSAAAREAAKVVEEARFPAYPKATASSHEQCPYPSSTREPELLPVGPRVTFNDAGFLVFSLCVRLALPHCWPCSEVDVAGERASHASTLLPACSLAASYSSDLTREAVLRLGTEESIYIGGCTAELWSSEAVLGTMEARGGRAVGHAR